MEASSIRSQDAQFADLHNRLQAMMKHISALNRDIVTYKTDTNSRLDTLNNRIETLSSSIARMDGTVSKLDNLPAMEKKLDEMKRDLSQTKSDLHISLDRHASGLRKVVGDTHSSLLGGIADNARGAGTYFLVAVGSQVVTVAAYLLYKRRKASSPKKYL